MTGHLDKVYEKVMGSRNGWLGGDGDVWERGPYWIDGLLPLAYILNDQALIEKQSPGWNGRWLHKNLTDTSGRIPTGATNRDFSVIMPATGGLRWLC